MKKNLLYIPVQQPTRNGADQRRIFGMDSFELSVLETFEETTVRQTFQEPIFYNLLRGKKIMQFKGDDPIEYLPGNTLIVPPRLEMKVDFPNSSLNQPTQCLSLTIDKTKIASSLSLLNNRYPRLDGRLWQLNMKQYSLMQNDDVSQLIYKLYDLAHQHTQEARIIAELTLTELLVLLFQNQNLIEASSLHYNNMGILNDIVRFIQENIDSPLTIEWLSNKAMMSSTTLYRSFKKEFNISPMDFVNRERIQSAKKMIEAFPHRSIAEISYAVGFNNPNYFSRIFKQYMKVSPTYYRNSTILKA